MLFKLKSLSHWNVSFLIRTFRHEAFERYRLMKKKNANNFYSTYFCRLAYSMFCVKHHCRTQGRWWRRWRWRRAPKDQFVAMAPSLWWWTWEPLGDLSLKKEVNYLYCPPTKKKSLGKENLHKENFFQTSIREKKNTKDMWDGCKYMRNIEHIIINSSRILLN